MSSTPFDAKRDDWDYSYRKFGAEYSSSVDIGQYLVRDFFVSSGVDLHYNYSEIPNYQRDTYEHYKYPFGDYYQERETYNHLERKSDNRTISISFEFAPGWGRVYEGRYASTALYIVDELRKAGQLNSSVSKEHMLALTDIIYQYQLKHYLDWRLHRIESLNAILLFLEKEGYTSDMGPYGYLLVQDVWDYFPRTSRQFGHEVKFGIYTQYSYGSQHLTQTESNDFLYVQYDSLNPSIKDTIGLEYVKEFRYGYEKFDGFNANLTASTEYYIPFNHLWQIDLVGAVYYSLYSRTTNERNLTNEVDSTSKLTHNEDGGYNLSISGTVSYIPDSRTKLTSGLSYNYDHKWPGIARWRSNQWYYYRPSYQNNTGEIEHFTILGQLIYRLSVPTTLRAGVSYHRADTDTNADNVVSNSDKSGYSFSLSLEHYLY